MLFRAILALETATAFARRCLYGVAYSQVFPGPEPTQARFVWSCDVPEISRQAAQVGVIGFATLLPDELTWPSAMKPESFGPALRALWKKARQHRPLPPAAILLGAAHRRDIPFHVLGGNVIQLGEGRFQHRIWSTVTSATSRVADRLCKDKLATNRLLADLDLPVPPQRLVSSVKEALAAAKAIGYPVVVKPLGGNIGKGVSANLKGRDEIAGAFQRARLVGSQVIVESYVEGQDYRLLVVGGRVTAAALRVPARVTGDGKQTIGALIDHLNSDPLRDGFRRWPVPLDQELNRLLERAGYELNTVLPEGEVIQLRSAANVSKGGSAIDVTEDVHPDNAHMAIRTVEAIGLDVAGVDFLTQDIAKSYRKVGGGIVEVNSRPGLSSHTWPVVGPSRDVAGAILETMFPPGQRSRVPLAIVAAASQSGPALAARVSALLDRAGIVSAVAPEPAGVEADGAENDALPEAIRKPVRDPRLEALIHTRSLNGIAERGLNASSFDVATVLEFDGSDAARIALDILLRADGGGIVLSADRALPEDVLSGIAAKRLVLVSTDPLNPALQRHLAIGGQSVFASGIGMEIALSIVNLPGDEATSPRIIATLPAATPPHLVEGVAMATAVALGVCPSSQTVCAILQEALNDGLIDTRVASASGGPAA